MKVPLFKQKRNTCGPTALKMVLQYWGRKISEKEIIKGIGGIKKYGVRTIKLAEFAHKLGFETELLSYNRKLADGKAKIKKPSVQDILKYIKDKVPVILAVRSAILYEKAPKKFGHFIVITGYQNGDFLYSDPDDGKRHKINTKKLLTALVANAADSSAYLLAIWPKY